MFAVDPTTAGSGLVTMVSVRPNRPAPLPQAKHHVPFRYGEEDALKLPGVSANRRPNPSDTYGGLIWHGVGKLPVRHKVISHRVAYVVIEKRLDGLTDFPGREISSHGINATLVHPHQIGVLDDRA